MRIGSILAASTRPGRGTWTLDGASVAAGAVGSLVVVPVLGPGLGWSAWPLASSAVLAAGGFAALTMWSGGGCRARWLGAGLVGVSTLVVGTQDVSLLTVLASPVLGVGIGMLLPRAGVRPRIAAIAAAASLTVLVCAAIAASGTSALRLAVGVACAAVALAPKTPTSASPTPRGGLGRHGALLAGAATVLGAGLVAFVAASDVTVQWFGHVITHGPRNVNTVALTFDDGPDSPYTLQIAAILEQHGTRGTFFTVGKALDAEPDVSRALNERGHLLGNHSYRHDGWSWLDPRYPELGRAQQAVRRQLGLCPTFYRPPHGERTPFLLSVVRSKGMSTVLWDVSVGDWNSHDPATITRKVLRSARPGSIIVLHDGLDGNPGADRSVLVRALPGILDGLKAKGLTPVRLDQLLGVPGYGSHC